MRDPKIGVIFKPKNIKNLKERLGDEVYKALQNAISTGRCHLYDDLKFSRYTTSTPPILAALSSDLCIHGHLGGTASLECALLDKPTLLIDREGVPYHNYYDFFQKDKVIFDDWDDAIDASLDFFSNSNNHEEIGNWNHAIRQLDPFNDDKGAERIGNFLKSINDSFDEGYDRTTATEIACKEYTDKWGKDKVIFS